MHSAEVIAFTSVGSYSGERYPAWVRELTRANGVYLIRELDTGEVVYVGESHTGRLYSTLTRHFQRWSDKHDTAGPTYGRGSVDVAVVIVPKSHAVWLQNELICALTPRDNRLICARDRLSEPDDETPPPDYGYDIDAMLTMVF